MIDTNVLVYALLEDDEEVKHRQALSLLEGFREDDSVNLLISIQVLKEFGNVARRAYGVGVSELERLMDELKILVPAVVGERFSTISLAARLEEEYGFEYWDSLIVAACLENGISILLTEDKKLCRISELKIGGSKVEFINPFA